MKLQNENTGQVENFCIDKDQICSCDRVFVYDSLTQLQEAGWKDYEEPKDWGKYIISCGDNYIEPVCAGFSDKTIEKCNELGMLFETEEEAEKAVEKLKAWQRLKDKGFRFDRWTIDDGLRVSICTNFDGGNIYSESEKETKGILDLLFGGEE